MVRRKNMYKVGLSTCGKVIGEELFRDYVNAGIHVMEIAVDQDAYGEIKGIVSSSSKICSSNNASKSRFEPQKITTLFIIYLNPC